MYIEMYLNEYLILYTNGFYALVIEKLIVNHLVLIQSIPAVLEQHTI